MNRLYIAIILFLLVLSFGCVTDVSIDSESSNSLEEKTDNLESSEINLDDIEDPPLPPSD